MACCASKLAFTDGTEPDFPELPPPRSNYDDFPVYANDDPYHRWLWTARAVKLGHSRYLGEAREWALKIDDKETREEALREMSELAECGEQLALL